MKRLITGLLFTGLAFAQSPAPLPDAEAYFKAPAETQLDILVAHIAATGGCAPILAAGVQNGGRDDVVANLVKLAGQKRPTMLAKSIDAPDAAADDSAFKQALTFVLIDNVPQDNEHLIEGLCGALKAETNAPNRARLKKTLGKIGGHHAQDCLKSL